MLITQKAVSKLLGVKPTKIYWLMKHGGLPYMKPSHSYRFIEESVLAWKEREEQRRAELGDTLSVFQVAEMLAMSVSSVYKLVSVWGMPCIKETKNGKTRYRFKESDIVAWLVEREHNKLSA